MEGKPRVAILTSLVDYSPAYSLVGIILDQARALHRHGYEYDILCLKNFNKKDEERIKKEGLHAKYILPQTYLHDYQPNEPARKTATDPKTSQVVLGFDDQVEVHFNGDPEKGWVGYKDALKSYEVVIDHDLMFLSWHLPQNEALRRCMKMWPRKNWLHWVHSGPSSAPADLCHPSTLRFTHGGGHYVYLNETQRLEYSLMIQTTKDEVSTVYNPKDIRDLYGFSKDTCALIDRYDLLDHEILMVYPFSTPRYKDKGIRQLLRLFSNWRKQKIKARLILVNAHCNSAVDQPKLKAIEAYATLCELELDKDVILTSRFADENEGYKLWRYTVPYKVVQDLMLASNMFIFPSVSECCSLIQAEASISGKFMVLNRDFPPMLEFSHPGVLTYEFTGNDPDANQAYYECVAREIWANFKSDAAIMNATKARTQFYNRDWIFRTQFEPLLYRRFSGDPRVVPVAPEPVRPEPPSDLPPQFRAALEFEGPSGETVNVPIEKVLVEKKKPAAVIKATKPPIEVLLANAEERAAEEPSNLASTDEPDWNDPKPGILCPIFGTCSEERRSNCYEEAGHCLMLDEVIEAK
ncbi:MAG: hypothetical protein JSW58_08275 [Candidatus Latescibacterota bacterium]|nr:MAG: hypothetical protein JSW58_08275 [Candidatus Latescibacterota bacterium]